MLCPSLQKCLLYLSPIALQEVVVGPENRTVVSKDNFPRVNLIGDFDGYNSIPTFEHFYLVTPRKVHHQITIDTLTVSMYLQCSIM